MELRNAAYKALDLKALNIIATRKAIASGEVPPEALIGINLGSAYSAKLVAAVHFGLFKPPAKVDRSSQIRGVAYLLLAKELGDREIEPMIIRLGKRLGPEEPYSPHLSGTSEKMYASIPYFQEFKLVSDFHRASRQARFGYPEFSVTQRPINQQALLPNR